MDKTSLLIYFYCAEDEEFEVEAILEHKKSRGKVLYLVKWHGFADEDSTWQERRDLLNASLILNEYECLTGLSKEKQPKKIVAHRVLECGEMEYLVEWAGLGTKGKEWQSREEAAQVPLLVAKYEEKESIAGEWEVECILDHRKSENSLEFLVKWTGWSLNDATWQSKEDLSNAQMILDKYVGEVGLIV